MIIGAISRYSPISYVSPYAATNAIAPSQKIGTNKIPTDEESSKVKKTDPNYKCQTCENRKYQDGSNESDVSFKSASKVAPESAASAVRNHEQMHVANAYQKAEKGNGKVISSNVTIHTSICPECGKTYVSGGTTRTSIKYSSEDNPYQKNLKSIQGASLQGFNLNIEA